MKYRDSVCAVLRRDCDGRVLVCHRAGYPADKGWQFPQGGYSKKKGIVDELKRELREEIGTDRITVTHIDTRSYTYNFPVYARSSRPGFAGQRQRWVLARFDATDSEIRFDPAHAEFDSFLWVEPGEALERAVDFKKDVYRMALRSLGLLS